MLSLSIINFKIRHSIAYLFEITEASKKHVDFHIVADRFYEGITKIFLPEKSKGLLVKILFKFLFLFICLNVIFAQAMRLPRKMERILRVVESSGLTGSVDVQYEDDQLNFSRELDVIGSMRFSILGDPRIVVITRKIRIPHGHFSGTEVLCYSCWDANDPYVHETFELLGDGTCRYR